MRETDQALAEIRTLLRQDPFLSSIEAIQESRMKVLKQYSLYPFLMRQLDEMNSYSEKRMTIRLETLDSYAHKFRDLLAEAVRR